MAEQEPYWQQDFAIDLGQLGDRPGFGVRFKVHQSEERFHYGARDELIPLTVSRGVRTYFHGKPYQLEPDYRLTIALHPVPPPSGEVGVVEEASWEGLRQREIGQAQAWYYPEDQILILWECFLEQSFRSGLPTEDPLHQAIWRAWEGSLVDHAPGVRRIVTTWEDLYDREHWQQFLSSQGYQPVTPAAFAKEVVER